MRSPWKLIKDFASRRKVEEASEQPGPPDAAAKLPVGVEQSDPLLAEPAEAVVSEGHAQPLSTAPLIQATEGEVGAGVLAGGPKKQRPKAARARKIRGEPSAIKKAAEEPAAMEKTFLDEATELDLEIKDLRLQLSAKLLEQNTHLRRMLERYNGK